MSRYYAHGIYLAALHALSIARCQTAAEVATVAETVVRRHYARLDSTPTEEQVRAAIDGFINSYGK